MTRYLLSAAVGAFAGILWLLFLGVPWLIPSYLSLRDDLQTARAAAAGQAEAFDASEMIRKDENQTAIEAVSNGRQSCEAEIASVTAVYEAALRNALGGTDNEISNVQPNGGRAIRPPGGLRDHPAMGEN